jgi:hypothetical protein
LVVIADAVADVADPERAVRAEGQVLRVGRVEAVVRLVALQLAGSMVQMITADGSLLSPPSTA